MNKPLNMTFDEIADLYDAVRPAYPNQLIDAVDSILKTTNGRILEVGCGTGQATALFARRGCDITALEPGPSLASLAAKNLSAFPSVKVEISTFEDWPIQEEQFDMVMSATAFHWVAPEIRYVKAAQALKDGGWLALFWNVEAKDDSPLAREIQTVYDTYMPTDQKHPYTTHHPVSASDAHRNENFLRWVDEIDRSELFGDVSVLQFPWSERYTTERYLQLLDTYSDHRTLQPSNKQGLFDGIAEILNRNGDGRNKQYVAVLYLARKR